MGNVLLKQRVGDHGAQGAGVESVQFAYGRRGATRSGGSKDGDQEPSHTDRRAARATAFAIRYTQRLAEAGIEPSVGSVGDSYDNVLAETIIGLYKAELIRKNGPWRNLEDVEFATLEWVDWFNHRRLLSSIGDVPPAEFEARYYARPEESTTEVGLN